MNEIRLFNKKGMKSLTFVIMALFILTSFSTVAMTATDSSDGATITESTKDAAGRNLDDSYDTSKIITVGPGALRWVSYMGYCDNVVCIDYGDINASSLSGKGYRPLLDDVDSESIIAKYGGNQSNPPLESDYTSYDISLHTHNNFTTADLESLGEWTATNMPTIMIVIKTLYDSSVSGLIEGLKLLNIDVVVIEDCVNFMNPDFTLHDDFVANLSILGTVFNDLERSNALQTSIDGFVKDIQSMIDGEQSKYKKAYIGSASNAGAKSLTWTVGSYLPFDLANVKNSYSGSSTQSEDAGTEVMSETSPSIIFMDLSSTTKFTGTDTTSNSVLTYAESEKVPIYTILPYFWFGYNFDNAIANAYYLVYVCYNGVLNWDSTIDKISDVYSAFYPEMKDDEKTIGGISYNGGEIVLPNMMTNFYKEKGSKLILDGKCQSVVLKDDTATYTAIDTPSGDNPEEENDENSDMTIYAVIAVLLIVILIVIGFLFNKRKQMS